MTTPVYIVGSWSRSTTPMLCERCGKVGTRHCRVYLAPYDPTTQPRRTPTHFWCPACAAEMGAVNYWTQTKVMGYSGPEEAPC